jgi:DNA invertase Pin-like site-specific DNA recombinase
MTREEARNEVKKLFKSGRVLYYSDIAKELKIDLELVVEICQELMEEGEIAFNVDNA